jgi:hypothetical protein
MTSSNASALDVPSSSRTAITRHIESLRSTALYTCIVNHTVLYRPCLFGVWSLPFIVQLRQCVCSHSLCVRQVMPLAVSDAQALCVDDIGHDMHACMIIQRGPPYRVPPSGRFSHMSGGGPAGHIMVEPQPLSNACPRRQACAIAAVVFNSSKHTRARSETTYIYIG